MLHFEGGVAIHPAEQDALTRTQRPILLEGTRTCLTVYGLQDAEQQRSQQTETGSHVLSCHAVI